MLTHHWKTAILSVLLLAGCGSPGPASQAADAPFVMTEVARFDEPWAMAFLPDGRLLITEKRGVLQLFDPASGDRSAVAGVPSVAYAGQGGFGDVVLHPDYATNRQIYLSYVEKNDEGYGAVVARARLELEGVAGQLQALDVIWQQVPKKSGTGHYGHRIAFDSDGYLWISSGDRQEFDPAQDMQSNLGKIVRLRPDGSVPDDNPFTGRTDARAEIWSLGHRNPLGIAFDSAGGLWNVEMGPRGGDELNRVRRGANYGYPEVSEGKHYSGKPIPDHDTRPEFAEPAISWTPVISPASLIFYSGEEFPQWQGDAFIGGLAGALVRVETDGDAAREAERFPMDNGIRAVAQGPDGALWLLERAGSDARLLKLVSR